MGKYILGIDQSTQGTKALIVDKKGRLCARCDIAHKQMISREGWISHNPEEIYAGTIQVVKNVVEKAGINKNSLVAVGISNQRETTAVWDRAGKPLCPAIVWQCDRARKVSDRLIEKGYGDVVRAKTGISLSPYFPASKMAWILENVSKARELTDSGDLMLGTMDAFLIYRLTGGRDFRTDYSNASRTQLFNISKLMWDDDLCEIFGVPEKCLPKVTASDACFGETDFDGYLDEKIPIHGVLGDSHAALLGHGCLEAGMTKTTYGTGSSVMMNVGEKPVFSENGIVSSLAWKLGDSVNYVLEGNINYAGAVISWLKNDVKLIDSAAETEALSYEAAKEDDSYLVPAFTGLGAPYWDSHARAILCNMSRTTGRAEIVRDAVECIAYQITDIIKAMEKDSGSKIKELCVDGGPTGNNYLMQFQSDMADVAIHISEAEEMSGLGAAYAAGLGMGFFDRKTLFQGEDRKTYLPEMSHEDVAKKYDGWKKAVERALIKN